MLRVGVLALQGAFAEHIACLEKLNASAFTVRLPQHLANIDGLIIPGGESTSIGRLMPIYGLNEPIVKLAKEGLPIWGTCAGLILLAQEVDALPLEPLKLLNIKVRRNAYGRQVDSFEEMLSIPVLGEMSFPGVFIRAPVIEGVEEGVEVLAHLNGSPVAVQQKNLLATTFHPELTSDLRLHAYFLKSVR